MSGRPKGTHTCTVEVATAIVRDLYGGLFLAQIAAKHNLSVGTIRNWLRQGSDPECDDGVLRGFAAAYQEADVEVERQTVDRIRRGATQQLRTKTRIIRRLNEQGEMVTVGEVHEKQHVPGDWQAAAWFAERRYPKRWGANREGQAPGPDALDLRMLQEQAASRGSSLDELFQDPPPDLDAVLERNRDKILELLGVANDTEKKTG